MIRGLVAAVVILVAVVVNQSAIHWRGNISDDQLFAYYGWCITQGARPYLDFWDNKPPGIFWINAIGIELLGPTRNADLLICGVAMVVTLAAFAKTVRLAFHKSMLPIGTIVGAIVLADQRFESGGNRTETFVVACEITCICGYLAWRRTRFAWWMILCGLAGGAAPLFKQSGLAALAACAIHFVYCAMCDARRSNHQRFTREVVRPMALVAPSAALPMIGAACVLAAQGALADARYAVGKFNQAYFAINDATWIHIDRALVIYWDTAFRMLIPILVLSAAGAALAFVRSSATNRRCRAGVGLFIIWFLLAAYLACVGPGRRAHHFMPALTPLALIALNVLNPLIARRGVVRTLTRSPAVAGCFIAFAAALFMFETGNIDELTRSWNLKPSWLATDYRSPPSFVVQGQAIRDITAPGDRIFVWGWNPGAYRIACRLPASRYATFEKRGQVGEYARFILDGALQDIRAHPPRVILFSTGDLEHLDAPGTAEFYAWLRSEYGPVDAVPGLLQRR